MNSYNNGGLRNLPMRTLKIIKNSLQLKNLFANTNKLRRKRFSNNKNNTNDIKNNFIPNFDNETKNYKTLLDIVEKEYEDEIKKENENTLNRQNTDTSNKNLNKNTTNRKRKHNSTDNKKAKNVDDVSKKPKILKENNKNYVKSNIKGNKKSSIRKNDHEILTDRKRKHNSFDNENKDDIPLSKKIRQLRIQDQEITDSTTNNTAANRKRKYSEIKNKHSVHSKIKQLKILEDDIFKNDDTENNSHKNSNTNNDNRKRKYGLFENKVETPSSSPNKKYKHYIILDDDTSSDDSVNTKYTDSPMDTVNINQNEIFDDTNLSSTTNCNSDNSDEDLSHHSPGHRVQHIRVEKGILLPFDDKLTNNYQEFVSVKENDNTKVQRERNTEDLNNYNSRIKKVEKGILLPFKDDSSKI